MNEKSFGTTLRALRESKKMSVKTVIEELKKYGQDITDKTLYSYENDKRAASADMLIALCQIYNCNNILETFAGIEPDYSIPDDSEWKLIEKYRFISEHSPEGIETVNYILNREYRVAEQIRDSTESSSESNIRYIQRYPRVASAGTGQVVFEDMPVDRIGIPDIPKYKRVSYAIEVNGNSMEPLYHDEDILLVEPTCQIDVGEIGIFIVGNEAYVKKLGEAELISLNKGYDNIPLTEDSKCMGRVVDKL